MTRARASQSGFTLLEVLIAAVLIGSVFVAVVSVMSQSLRNIDRMRPHEIALQHAREKMTEELLRDELAPETATGSWSDGYQWRVDIAPYELNAPQPGAPAQTTGQGLFKIRVTVAWGDPQRPRTYEVATTQWAKWMAQR